MRPIAVLGDLHLGRSLYGYSLTERIRATMYRFFRFCVKHEVVIAVQLGDIFDSPRPTIEQEKIAIQWCNEFERAQINLFLINGNHDATGKRGLGSALDVIRANRFSFVNVINRPLLVKHPFTAYPYTGPPLYFLPFPSPSLFQEAEAWKQAATSNFDSEPITFCHLNVEGAKLGEQDLPYRGDQFNLPDEVIAGSSLVVGGHIHKPQRIGRGVYLVGAAERLRFDERNDPRYFTLVKPEVTHYARSDSIQLCQLLLDASGDQLTTTEDVKRAIGDKEVARAIVKVVPYVDELSTVDWSEVVAFIYKQGADHVVLGAPINVKRKQKKITKGKLDPVSVAKRFIVSRIKDKQEQKQIYRRFQRLIGVADAD